jgi:hypothetical protein
MNELKSERPEKISKREKRGKNATDDWSTLTLLRSRYLIITELKIDKRGTRLLYHEQY